MSITDLVTELLVQWENNPALTPEELCREHERQPEHAVLLEAVKLAIRDIQAADSMLNGPYEEDSCSRATPGPRRRRPIVLRHALCRRRYAG